MEQFFAALGIVLGIAICGFFARFGRRDSDGSGMGNDKENAKRIDTSLGAIKGGIDRSESGIDATINSLKRTNELLDSIEKRNRDMASK